MNPHTHDVLLKSHPWITFRAYLDRLSYQDWMMLGEAQSKCEHIADEPLLPEARDALHRIYLAKGVLATTAIEGNTLSEAQVLQRMEGSLQLPPSKEYLGQEIDNILDACNAILEHMMEDEGQPITLAEIQGYNALVLRGLAREPGSHTGELRKESVGVGTYLAPPAQALAPLLERLVTWLNEDWSQHAAQDRIAFGILKAIVAHLYIAWIHPFGDGNGRTARLLEFRLLLAAGVPSAAAQLLSNHYNETRSEYYRQLERASRSGGDMIPFIRYALQGFVDGLHAQLAHIRRQQVEVHWLHYIYETFRDQDGKVDKRQRNLVLDLTKSEEPVLLAELRYISPRVAEAYAGLSGKTLIRDVKHLEQRGLLGENRQGVYARTDLMLERRPLSRKSLRE